MPTYFTPNPMPVVHPRNAGASLHRSHNEANRRQPGMAPGAEASDALPGDAHPRQPRGLFKASSVRTRKPSTKLAAGGLGLRGA